MSTEKFANPGPLGLVGFGMTTILLNLHNAGFFPIATAVVAMGIFYGGLTQVIVGILEFRRGNTFTTTAYISYGIFWLTLVSIWYLPTSAATAPTDPVFLGIYLGIWGIFTFFMFLGTLKDSRGVQFIYATLTLLFLLLAVGNIAGNNTIVNIAGFIGIACGASAVYVAVSEILKEQYGRVILPIGAPKE